MRTSLSLLMMAPLLASSAFFVACGGGTVSGVDEAPVDPGTGSSSGGSSSGGVVEPPPFGLPALADLKADEFTFMKPAGDTVCALGGEYGFAVRPGDPNKVVIEFEGGGACFNNGTCGSPASTAEQPVFKDFVRGTDYTGSSQVGLRDHGNAENPIQGWTHVIVPYCSADVHWGDKETTYGENTIQHRGAKNTGAVLEYVYSQLKTPQRLFMTGCSAGGYGATYYTAGVKAHYPTAAVNHFSDSAAGVMPEPFFTTLSDAWGFQSTFPTEIGSGAEFTKLSYIFKGMAAKYPDVHMSQYNTVSDTTQSLFFSLMGGSGWQAGMLANIGELVKDVPTFREYMSDGAVHCIIEKNDFYSKQIADTKLSTWVGNIANGTPVSNVNCPSCKLPE